MVVHVGLYISPRVPVERDRRQDPEEIGLISLVAARPEQERCLVCDRHVRRNKRSDNGPRVRTISDVAKGDTREPARQRRLVVDPSARKTLERGPCAKSLLLEHTS